MPIAPAPFITGQQTWKPVDNSGVAYDFTKLASMPQSLYECDGYREHLSDDGWVVERVWRCNWSDVAAAMQWFYGYSFMAQQKTVNAEAPSPNGLLPGTGASLVAVPPGVTSTMSRILPAQDPYRPYLYADHVEVVEGIGVVLQDPGLFLNDILGQPINTAGVELKTPGAERVLKPSLVPPKLGVGPAGGGAGGAPFPFQGFLCYANFSSGPFDPAAYNLGIEWGDGEVTEIGDVEFIGGIAQLPIFSISASHTYAKKGTYTVKVLLDNPDADPKEFRTTVTITVGAENAIGDDQGAGAAGAAPGQLAPDPLGRQPIPGLVYAELRGPSQILPNGGVAGSFFDGAATLRVTYRARNYVLMNDKQLAAWDGVDSVGEMYRYVERVPNYAIQAVPLQNISRQSSLTFTAAAPPGIAGTLVPEAGILLVPTASWKYIWHDVPFYPATAILTCQGKVNDATFDGIAGFPPFAPQTLLCQAPEIQMRRNACGQMAFRVTWTLDYRPDGWNSFPTGGVTTQKFWPATFGGAPPAANGANLVFVPTDFSQLFAIEDAFVFT